MIARQLEVANLMALIFGTLHRVYAQASGDVHRE